MRTREGKGDEMSEISVERDVKMMQWNKTTRMTNFKTLDSFCNALCIKLGFEFSPIKTLSRRTKSLAMALLDVLLTCGMILAKFWSLRRYISEV